MKTKGSVRFLSDKEVSGPVEGVSIPDPKLSHVISRSELWKQVLEAFATQKPGIEVSGLRETFPKLRQPTYAFITTLRRYVAAQKLNYQVYSRNGNVYAIRRKA